MRRRAAGAERARLTRRAALIGAAGLALAGPAGAAAADAEALEVDALVDLIGREQAASVAYGAVGMTRLAAHEAEHALALRPHLQHLGHRLPELPRSARDMDRAAARLARAEPGRRLAAAVDLEEALLAAHREALVALRDPATIRTAATVMASHGQHLAVLSAAGSRTFR